jgi:DNA-binding transcriptional ArsR family regulator
MVMRQRERLTRAFHALADPTRRQILEQLAREEHSVMRLAEMFTISQPAVTKHLRVLESSGLISRRKSGRQRICRAEPAGIADAAQWITRWSAFWNARLDGLEEFLAHTQQPRKQ